MNENSSKMACKIKHFLALVICVSLSSLLVCMYTRDQPVNFHQFVTQTHKQFESFKENLQVGSNDKKLVIEEKYLSMLGFTKTEEVPSSSSNNNIIQGSPQPVSRKSNAYSTSILKNGTLPIVIVSAVPPGQIGQVVDFIKNVRSILPSNPIVLWCLDTVPSIQDSDFSLAVRQLCNSSKCSTEKFNFEDYPDHVKDTSITAYRPLIIQTMLDRGGCILWLDINRRLLPFTKDTLSEFLSLAMDGGSQGIVGWSSGHPTSTLTHPKMFSYFQTNVENYYFHRMIDPAELLVCNTPHILSKVMLPWVKCSLIVKCISPFGAQSSGCRFDKKPLFRYSGCHAYDSAALNVALGLAYPLHQPYISRAPISRPAELLPSLNQTTSS